jgi:hypothetical protein
MFKVITDSEFYFRYRNNQFHLYLADKIDKYIGVLDTSKPYYQNEDSTEIRFSTLVGSKSIDVIAKAPDWIIEKYNPNYQHKFRVNQFVIHPFYGVGTVVKHYLNSVVDVDFSISDRLQSVPESELEDFKG